MRKLAIYAGIAGLIAAPLTAQQSDTSAARQSAPVSDESDIGGQNNLIFLLGVAAVAAAVAFLSEDGDDAPISA
ncbi:hypothetical protein ACRAQ7_01605 [Erythrobacter sp. W53]|uniref:hypothetical protein n=1 Tax=Erythrobacteraceae TaxID=335929 RepID=UPI0036D43D4F